MGDDSHGTGNVSDTCNAANDSGWAKLELDRVAAEIKKPISSLMPTAACRWQLRSRAINEVVVASDQWEAWDTLSERSIFDFGLVVSAEPDKAGDGEAIPVHTATLMRRWGREDDAEQFDELGPEGCLL